MLPDTTTSVRAAGPVLRALIEAGVSVQEVGKRLGVDAGSFADPEGRLPSSIVARAWDFAEEVLDDPSVGLRIAQAANREAYDIFSYIASASSTLSEATMRVQRYFRLLANAAVWELTRDGDQVWWTFRSEAGGKKPIRHDEEYALAISCTYARLWTEDAFQLNEVFFRHPKPRDTTELEAFFRAPLRFGADRCAYRYDAAWLSASIRGADSKLTGLLERYAEETLAALPEPGRYALEVRKLIARGLSSGEMSLSDIAMQLTLSERSLQRRLKDEGASHKELLEDVRRELAVRYLTNQNLTASEVAYMIPLPGPLFFVPIALAYGVVFFLPYLIDRLVARRFGGFTATLVLPVAWVAVEYVHYSLNPIGQWGQIG